MSSEEPSSYRTTDEPTNSKVGKGEGKNRLPRSIISKFMRRPEPCRLRNLFVKRLRLASCSSGRRGPVCSTFTGHYQTKNGGWEGEGGAEPDWVITMKEKLSIKPLCCIYRLPQAFLDGNEDACVPQIVSIGPFHHGKQSLQPMEEYKLWYLQFLLHRNGGFMSKERLLDIVKSWEKEAREYYSETIDLGSDAFAMMMLLDCCFLIALFLKKMEESIWVKDDPIFKMRWVMPALRRDLLMLENQAPFFILQTLFDHINTREAYTGPSLEELALHFFNDSRPNLDMKLKHNQKDNSSHLLHLFYNSLIPEKLRKKSEEDFPPVSRINSIIKLQDAGLKLRKCKGESFLDISFTDHGILEIPSLQVQDFTCSQLVNLVAFEQCYHGVPTLITAYAFFMDCLIDSPEDVGILRQDRIIDNWLGNDEQVANLFNKLCKDVVIQTEGCYLSNVLSDVNEYCRKKWPARREKLMRNYFQSPWAIISLVGAIFLFILTIAQTIISFVAYLDPPSS